MDLARWGLGKNEFPKTVIASGGRFGYSDDGQTPNTLLVAFEFDDCELQFEVRGLVTNDEPKVKIGDIFYGTEGILAITSYEDWQTFLGPKLETGPGGKGGGDHFANFVKAVKARDRKLLERRHRGGPPFERLLPPGQHRLPAGPQAPHQPLDRVVRQRPRGRRDAHAGIPGTVRRAGQGLSEMTGRRPQVGFSRRVVSLFQRKCPFIAPFEPHRKRRRSCDTCCSGDRASRRAESSLSWRTEWIR